MSQLLTGSQLVANTPGSSNFGAYGASGKLIDLNKLMEIGVKLAIDGFDQLVVARLPPWPGRAGVLFHLAARCSRDVAID